MIHIASITHVSFLLGSYSKEMDFLRYLLLVSQYVIFSNAIQDAISLIHLPIDGLVLLFQLRAISLFVCRIHYVDKHILALL